MDETKKQFEAFLTKVKSQWLENPKNAVWSYVQTRRGGQPDITYEEGRLHGLPKIITRATIVVDPELGIIAFGDGESKKDAGKAAAFHGMMQLVERDLFAKPVPSAASPAPNVPVAELIARLTDGSTVSPDRGREFLDYFCHEFDYRNVDFLFEEVKLQHGRRLISGGWKSVVTIADTPVAESIGSSKKHAKAASILSAVKILEAEHPDLWKKFQTMPANAVIGRPPPVLFETSAALEHDMRVLFGHIRDSDLYQARLATGADTTAAAATTLQLGRDPQTVEFTPEQHKEKSAAMLEKLNAYQTDEKVKSVRESREALPVMQHSGDVLVKVELNPVTICMAATGSGKTTQVPQILLDDAILRQQGSHCNIICTQPRRIAAISVAHRVAKERGENTGQTVGYQVRFDSKLPKPHGSITFCTTGVFLRRLQSALDSPGGTSFLDHVSHVLMDEVHERDVDTDLLLVVIKRVLADRAKRGKPPIKLVLMSATVDPHLFQKYFQELSRSGREVPVVSISGRSFPVSKYFLEHTVSRLESMRLPHREGGWVWSEKSVQEYVHREITERGGLMEAASQDDQMQVDDLDIPYPLVALMIADVLSRSDDGHVLVFLPGWDEIKVVHQMLLDTKQFPLLGVPFDDTDKYEVHILHSSVPVEDQQAVFEKVRAPGIRRIILSTNIAETSVTIPDVVFVVDTGRVKEKRYDPARHLSSLVSAWVGRSNLNQRAGRAGRHRPGEYYGVLSQTRYDRLNIHQTVEIKRVDLSNVVMHIKALNLSGMEVEDVLAATIEPPAADRVHAAMEDLARIGALDHAKNLTSLGRVLQHLPLEVSIGKMCLYGAFFRCLDPALTLAAILTNRDPFMAPMHLKKEANEIRESWCPPLTRSDPLCILNAFYEWTKLQTMSSAQANRFLYNNMLSRPTMMQIQQVKQNLFQSLEKVGVVDIIRRSVGMVPRYRRRVRETDPEFNTNSNSMPLLTALIAVAVAPNFAVRMGERTFRTSQDKTCFVHPSSVCSFKFAKKTPGLESNVYAFAEKVRNVSKPASGGGGSATTYLRGCTRLDPLAYMLFGATEARSAASGLECDNWLPVAGHYGALDVIERIKATMDTCLLRVFEGLHQRHVRPPTRSQRGGRRLGKSPGPPPPQDDPDDDQYEDEDEVTPPSMRALSDKEMEQLESMTSGVVQLLNCYAVERYDFKLDI